MDWMIWLVAALFYMPLHLGLPVGLLFYRTLGCASAERQRLLQRFLLEGLGMLLLSIALAALIWWLQWPLIWLVLELVLASLLPFWRAARLAQTVATDGNG